MSGPTGVADGFEPNGVNTNEADCNGLLYQTFPLHPTLLQGSTLYNQLTLIGGQIAGGEGPLVFYVSADVLEVPYVVTPDDTMFYIPAPQGSSPC